MGASCFLGGLPPRRVTFSNICLFLSFPFKLEASIQKVGEIKSHDPCFCYGTNIIYGILEPFPYLINFHVGNTRLGYCENVHVRGAKVLVSILGCACWCALMLFFICLTTSSWESLPYTILAFIKDQDLCLFADLKGLPFGGLFFTRARHLRKKLFLNL